MASNPKVKLTPAEYLEIERNNEARSEYIDGEVVSMTGASRWHNLIVTNTGAELHRQLKGKPCEVYLSEMRVHIPSLNIYTYPDIAVVCGEPTFEDAAVETLLNPKIVIEVLSPSTESYDRGKKSVFYKTIESLAELLLIAQDEHKIEHSVKHRDGRWLSSETTRLDGLVELASIGCVLRLSEVYDKVRLLRS